MKKVGIATDSHSGISPDKAEKNKIFVLPMPFYLDDECYYEGINLTRDLFFDKVKKGAVVKTSQPMPEKVMEMWDKALKEYDELVYIPMSSGLSGSCATAKMLAQEEQYEGRVFVVDNGRVSAAQERSVYDALDFVKQGFGAEEIKEILEEARSRHIIYIGIDNLDYLKRGGRISRTTAAIGSVLNIKPVLRFNTGILETYKKCRGMHQARKAMIEAMRQEFDGEFKAEYENNEVYLLMASSADEAMTGEWRKEVTEAFPNLPLVEAPLSLGLSCHIGPGGLGIGCSCKPRIPEKQL